MSSAAGEVDAALDRIGHILLGTRGIDLGHYKRGYLLRRLAVRQRARGIPDLGGYADLLQADPGEAGALLGILTIKLSEFFRNPELFRLLESRVLPDLLRGARAAGRPLRAWCAGCATGEEAYSVAILLGRLGAEAVALTGTDVDPAAIRSAREGVFEELRLREVDRATLREHFEPAREPRSWRLRTEGLPAVRFRVQDLLGDRHPRDQDLILCRNVLIYFETSRQEQIIQRFADALRPGGVLVLGRVERLLGPARSRFEPVELRERIYRRLGKERGHAR